MSFIVDSRVRLPNELRPPEIKSPENLYDQYEQVLDVSSKIGLTLSQLNLEISEAKIDHAVIHVEYEHGDGVDQMNETVAELVKKNPQKFSGFGSVSLAKRNIKYQVSQVKKIAELGLIGINMQPAFLGYEIDSRELYPIYSAADDLDLIVSLHTGINYARSVPMSGHHPLKIDQISSDFQDLKIIACHAGWPWVNEMVAVARRHPTVFLEFGALSPKYVGAQGTGWETLRRFMDNVLSEQILYGSDWPVMNIARCLKEWNEMELKASTLENLLWKNAAKLFNLNLA